MLGFELDLWDYVTFAAIFVTGVAGIVFFVLLAGLPGRIAIAVTPRDPDSAMLRQDLWADMAPTLT